MLWSKAQIHNISAVSISAVTTLFLLVRMYSISVFTKYIDTSADFDSDEDYRSTRIQCDLERKIAHEMDATSLNISRARAYILNIQLDKCQLYTLCSDRSLRYAGFSWNCAYDDDGTPC